MRRNTDPTTYLLFGSAGSVTRDNILIATSALGVVAIVSIAAPIPPALALIILGTSACSIGIRQALYSAYHTMAMAYFQWLAITVISSAWALVATTPHLLWPPLLSLIAFGITHIICNRKK